MFQRASQEQEEEQQQESEVNRSLSGFKKKVIPWSIVILCVDSLGWVTRDGFTRPRRFPGGWGIGERGERGRFDDGPLSCSAVESPLEGLLQKFDIATSRFSSLKKYRKVTT